uniref:Peptidase A2 domain-containing protein n=1 Tax=Rhizophagus irregularis (strain DAOM 181602 / DAOM 197198 / MUCL 43194) TaxID=747089 RepID=U9UM68_RHIID
MKTQFTINNKEIEVIIDLGAAVSVITEKLRKELDIPIKGKSNITCTLANGGKIASLGKVNTKIKIYKELIIPVTLDVIDSRQKEIIIGNDLLDKWNANINYKERILELENDEEIIDISVWYIKQVEESEKSNYGSESEESDYE